MGVGNYHISRPTTRLRNAQHHEGGGAAATADANWIEVRTKLLRALGRYPEAMEAVRIALAGDEDAGVRTQDSDDLR